MNLKQLKPKLNFIKKNTRPILTRIKVGENSLSCTDLETYLVIKDNHGMKIGMQNHATLGLTDSLAGADDYPMFSVDGYHRDIIALSYEKLERCLQFASKDETRLYLNGVAINKGHVVATDGHTLKSFETGEPFENDYILPSEGIKTLLKLLKGYKLTGLINIKLNDQWAIIENAQFNLSMRLIQREYPKWECIIPTGFKNTVAIENFDLAVASKELFVGNKGHGCRLASKNGEVYLTPKDFPTNSFMIGRCKKDDEFEIGFNFDYLVRAANKTNEFTLKFNNELSPCEVNECIVMPLKL